VPTDDLSDIESQLSFLAYDFCYTHHVNDNSMFNNSVQYELDLLFPKNAKVAIAVEGVCNPQSLQAQTDVVLDNLTHLSDRIRLPSLSGLPAIVSALSKRRI
jgi:hypothetical protein